MIIEKLTLQSHNLSEQFDFYVEKLGFDLLQKSDDSFSIKIGRSVLVFQKSPAKCYYHFALNIPSFRILKAMNWVKDRVTFLKYKNETIVDFPNWNAKALYFFDADNNIVEFIDRRNLKYETHELFSIKSIFEISEVGLPVNNIRNTFQQLNEQAGIQRYSGNLDDFCAAGNEHGLFIIVNQNDKKWLPTTLPATAFPFELEFQNDLEKYLLKCDGKEIRLEKKNKM